MKQRVRTSGGEFAYVDQGEGPAVVLLHGFPTSSYLWRAFVPGLAARFRVIAPDLLGYGDSQKPEEPELSAVAQAGYVRELLSALGIEKFAVVGHDLGGAVAQLLTLEGGVAALVLIDAASFDSCATPAVHTLQATPEDQRTPEFVRDVISFILDAGVARKERLTEEVAAAYRRPFEGPEGAAAFFRAVRRMDLSGLEGRDDDLAALECPVLIVWGEEDPFLPVEVGERLNDLIATSSLALLPGCSHFVTEDATETLVPLVYEYLRARYLSEPHGHQHGPPLIELKRRP